MKKIILFSLFCIAFVKLAAFEIVGQPLGTFQNIVISDLHEEWTVGLEDGTWWDLMPMESQKKQTWWQWLNGAKKTADHFDDAFASDPSSWKCCQQVQVYECSQNAFEGFNYILENISTGKKVLAKSMTFGERLIPQLEFAKDFFSFPWKELKIESNQSSMNNAFILDDETIWLLTEIKKRDRSWKKWWNGLENDQPDLPFLVEFDKWEKGNLLQLYRYPSEPNQLLYLIENKTTSQLAYARPISLAEFANLYKQYVLEAYNLGFGHGYDTGFSFGQGVCQN